jgi:phosphatidylglycerophosphate synthase
VGIRWFKLIPSAVSVFRLGIGLAFPWLPSDWRLVAAIVAALSDLLDGPLSRWLQVEGKFGQILDPIADKIFVAGVLITLLLDGQLAWWEIALVGTRDFAVLLAAAALAIREGLSAWHRMPPRFLGKLTTAVQFAFILSFCWEVNVLTHGLAIAVAVVGAAALVDYVIAHRATR